MKTSDRIKILRILNGYTQDELAKTAGVNRVSINRWENGLKSPSGISARRLAYYLKVDAALFSGDCGSAPESAVWQPQAPKNPAYFGQMQEDLVKCLPPLLRECEVDSVVCGRMANGMAFWLLGSRELTHGGRDMYGFNHVILSDNRILTGFIHEAIDLCMVSQQETEEQLAATNLTDAFVEVAKILGKEGSHVESLLVDLNTVAPADVTAELVNALKLCAEQVRLFMELHDDDEDAPIAYDAAQSILTKIGRGL